jgi:5-methyltetrahydrofolate--homocysteine methyltransferase
MKLTEKKLLILDGACGTSIQNMDLPAEVWDGNEGCNEYLNLSCPEKITAMHREFLEAGADIIETNTFGATSIVLGEYGLEDKVQDINTAAVKAARQAVNDFGRGWVAGSCGPGTKLPSLGHITVEKLAESYAEQFTALLNAGVDMLILETAQDILQIKTSMITAFDVMKKLNKAVPLMISVTIEKTGTMLAGTDIAAAAAIIEPFPIFALGLNCATGPEDMQSTIHWLSHNWNGRISCLPNQGMPEIIDGVTCYPMTPEHYADEMKQFVEKWGVSLAGGCCGSTPAHIAALKKNLAGVMPAEREVNR